MNNEQLYKDFEALDKEASLGGGLNLSLIHIFLE